MSQAAAALHRLPDLSYTPGDLTEPEHRLASYQELRQRQLDQELPLNRLCLQEEQQPAEGGAGARISSAAGRQFPALAAAQARYQNASLQTPSLTEFAPGRDLLAQPQFQSPAQSPAELIKMPLHSITEKPNERCPSPVVPAYANFELAKRMHQDNLDHQPLPDCVADLAYRRAQISGGHGGLALDIDPIATGVGVKTHNAGPTHCTKLKVFRPKTGGGGGVLPKPFNGRDVGSAPAKKMGAMDLAIGWDFRPGSGASEPRLARHIDGSNESAGPAVFSCVKATPGAQRDASAALGRSAGVFTSTLGEPDFFDKDLLRRKSDFGGRVASDDNNCGCDYAPPATSLRARSVSRDSSASRCRRAPELNVGLPANRLAKQYQSTPLLGDRAYQALRDKYLGPDADADCAAGEPTPTLLRSGCQHMRRPTRRLCHKVAPAPASSSSPCCPAARGHCLGGSKVAFRAGMPRLNATGDFVGISSGCGGGGGGAGRVLVVPRPRQPYAKRNYDIDTLVPPFRSQAGGAGQGGYPEHWRLASVYQHAYKPIDQRRRPLLQTVYK